MEPRPNGCSHTTMNTVEREPLTGDRAEHAFCSSWGGCTGRRPQSSASLPLGVFRSSPLTCALVREHRQRKAEHITMPGSPQGQGQTDKPTGTSLLRGSKESRRKPRKIKLEERKYPSVLHQLVVFCSPKSRLLKLVFFCHPLLLYFREFQHSSWDSSWF